MRMYSLAACLGLSIFLLGCREEPPPDDTDLGVSVDLGEDLGKRPPDLGGWQWDLQGADPGAEAERVDSPDKLSPATPRLVVNVADVGQGDGSVVFLPGGKVLVVDGGPSASRFRAVLDAFGATRVDYVVLSHAHADHYGGLIEALGRMPSDCQPRVFDPGLSRTLDSYNNFLRAAGCRYQKVAIGQTLNLDPAVDATVVSVFDRPILIDPDDGINNSSIILRLRYGRFSMLFEGDAEVPAERAALAQMGSMVRSTVLKIGHHGSCTSTGKSYLEAVAPQFATMSMSKANTFGHPHCQTIDKFKARPGLAWGRTDKNGPITLNSDGVAYHVKMTDPESDPSCPRYCAAPQDF